MNRNLGMTSSSVRDFTRINSLELHDLKIKEVPQQFIDEVYEFFL